MKEKEDVENENEIIITTSTEENLFEFLEELDYNYKIIKFVNKSNISKIYHAENIKEKRSCFLKVIEKKKIENNYEEFIEQINREEKILKLCESDNIINLYQKIETKNYIILEFEYCGIDLSTYIKEKGPLKKNIQMFKDILKGISEALEILNENRIMHRDIKPSNIFIEEKYFYLHKIKLGGFGCSIFIKDNKSEPIGSIFYTAPEIIKGIKYDEKCDLWSLGVSLYELLFGELPYGKNVSLEKIKNLISMEENIYNEKISEPELNELFKKLLTVNRYNRINFQEFFDLIVKIEIIEIDKEIKIITDIPHCSFPIELYEKKKRLQKKLKKKETFLDYNKFECTDDKKIDIVIDEDDKIVEKIKNIIEQNKLPDIMNIPNVITDLDEMPKFNNIIYYDENINFINSVHRDSDYFEKITSGAFILCTNLDSLKLIKDEIIYKNKINNNKIEFNIIVTGSKCEKIMIFLENKNNKELNNYITNICIYCMKPETYQHLKIKYPKIHDDIYKKRQDIVNFINKNSSENIVPYPLTKLLTYEEYIDKYKERHKKISEFYGDLNPETYENQISDIKDIIIKDSLNSELKQKDEKKVLEGFKTFDINKDLEKLNEITIQAYAGKYIYKDLNRWLLELKNNYESIYYFTSRLMYHLNSYALKKKMFYNNSKKILYRGIQIPYSNLLPYERARGKIIILTSFTSTSENKDIAYNFAKRKNSKDIYKKDLLFSVLFIIKNIWEIGYISNGINIQNISEFKKEKEVLFQPFSFYYVEKVDINLSKYIADIYLETIGKTEIFEGKLKEGKELFYDGSENIIRFKNSNKRMK